MISERYLCRLSVRISWRKVPRVAEVTAVRSRLMKAVFFFRDESSVLFTAKRSARGYVSMKSRDGYNDGLKTPGEGYGPFSPSHPFSFKARSSPGADQHHARLEARVGRATLPGAIHFGSRPGGSLYTGRSRRRKVIATSGDLVVVLLRYVLTQVVVLRSGKVSRHRCLRGSRAFDSGSISRFAKL